MPSGRVHTWINTLSYGALLAGASYALERGWLRVDLAQAALFSAGFWAGTLLLSPDLDLAEGSVRSKRAWGPLGALWVPYGLIFRHRGLSHSWLVGPLTRLLYLALLVGALLSLLSWLLPALGQALLLYLAQLTRAGVLPWVWLLAGYYLSQWLHLIADGIRPDTDFRRWQARPH
jgi:uncharacterized metal-binding protein